MTTLPFHNVVSNAGWRDDDSIHTFNLGLAADGSAITQADVGRAVALDPSGPNKVRLAQDGDNVLGILVSVGFANAAGPGVAGVAFKFIEKLGLLAADTAAVGNSVQGSTHGATGADDARGGYVKKAAADNQFQTVIFEKATDSSYVVVARL